ncbi:hypothetical protein [Paludibacterium purpuratum]|uniref:Enamine deaminase RidA (YjgF/YER057c/UK114 family) n=1 Tax=Paludibacterium purpuratum TaxID=1144873 RepID=A0A4R7B262_9NEIS|nr:hypothetical protein [Paludibacterium purpuratum]TDR77786.1 enamine deaminase RidA (YjgF/YER057c/UK114 family) [Paludibacterium purpuratum]
MNAADRLRFCLSETALSVPDLSFPEPTLLGMSAVGAPCAAVDGWPRQSVRTPRLPAGAPTLYEYWFAATSCRRGRYGDIRYSATPSLLFGVVELDEAAFTPASGTPLSAAAETAYRQIFALLAEEDRPHLWRVWNYVPEINRVEHSLERYRQFNIGRHQAFGAFERPVDSSPAACALGVGPGPLSIAFLAARTPADAIENPRQVSAFVYPSQYGPKSPTFTRAALARLEGQAWLFISGTASIVGHETVHVGDVAAQTRETMVNIGVLVDEANRRLGADGFSLSRLCYRVYVRHAADYPLVRQALVEAVGPTLQAVYVQADVCRHDLLMEIEAQACHPLA